MNERYKELAQQAYQESNADEELALTRFVELIVKEHADQLADKIVDRLISRFKDLNE